MSSPSTASLVDVLRQSQLVGPEHQDELVNELLPRHVSQNDLMQALLQRGWLTGFQVQHLLHGQAADLVRGPYILLDVLGQGGMGQVYKARHLLMNRLVALKVIRQDLLANSDVVRRFRREIQAAAQLTHPNIVIAYHAEQVGDAHLLVLEYCEGLDLRRLVSQTGPLPIGQACNYMRQAALGLQHAFERGLVHRDVKPSNLLVTGSTVKILDFGLALLRSPGKAEAAGGSLTEVGSLMGTPDFLAPEQARNASTVDIRADLYSLGCTLYYLLAGQVPFPGGSLAEKVLRHQTDKPPPLEVLRADVPPAVAAIVQRLLAKAPGHRYQTPAQLAAALEPFVGHGGWLSPATAAHQPANRRKLDRPEPMADPNLTTSNAPSFRPMAPIVPGKPATPRAPDLPATGSWHGPAATGGGTLVEAPPAAQPVSGQPPARRCRRPFLIAGVAAALVLTAGAGVLLVLIFGGYFGSTPGQHPADPPRPLRLSPTPQHWRPGSAQLSVGSMALSLAFSPNGTLLAVGTGDMEKFSPQTDGVVVLWDLAKNREAATLPQQPAPCRAVAFSPDGQTLAWGTGTWNKDVEGKVTLWDLAEKKARKTFTAHANGVYALAFHPEGKILATAGRENIIRLWNTRTGEELTHREGHSRPVNALAFSHDGKWLASASADKTVVLWQVDGWQNLGPMDGRAVEWVSCVAFSPDDKILVAATGVERDRALPAEIWLWDVQTRKPRRPPLTLAGSDVFCLAFAPDGRSFVTGGANDTAHVWETTSGKKLDTIQHGSAIFAVAYAPDGQTLATAGDGPRRVRLWKGE